MSGKLHKALTVSALLLLTGNSFATICVNTSTDHRILSLVANSRALIANHTKLFKQTHFNDFKLIELQRGIDLFKSLNGPLIEDCNVLLGLYNSRDCLLAANALAHKNSTILSPTCGLSKMNNYKNKIYSLLPPIDDFVIYLAKRLNQRTDLGKVYLLYLPSQLYGRVEFEKFKKHFKQPFTAIPITHYGNFDQNALKQHQNKTLIFFGYVIPSVKALIKLDEQQLIDKSVIIIGSSSWHMNIPILKPITPLLSKAQQTLFTDVTPWGKTTATEYSSSDFNIALEDKLTRDATKLAIECHRAAMLDHEFSDKRFHACITHGVHHGVAGDYTFTPGSAFAKRKVYLVNIKDVI